MLPDSVRTIAVVTLSKSLIVERALELALQEQGSTCTQPSFLNKRALELALQELTQQQDQSALARSMAAARDDVG